MTERERLVELLDEFCWRNGETDEESDCSMYFMPFESEIIADYLLKNGVIVPPCKVGDTVWVIWQGFNDEPKIRKDKVWDFTVYSDKIVYETVYLSGGVYGVNLFSTREEAEKALEEKVREKNE